MSNLQEDEQAEIAQNLHAANKIMAQTAMSIAAAFHASDKITCRNISWRARMIHKEMQTLMRQMKAFSEKEFQGAAWVQKYSLEGFNPAKCVLRKKGLWQYCKLFCLDIKHGQQCARKAQK
jgi:hypothetical protein